MDIYVGNLPWSINNDGLKDYFEQYGTVNSARVITDRESGRSKGFGFVEMPNEEEANSAIEASNGVELDGRPIRVNQSEPRQPRNDYRR